MCYGVTAGRRARIYARGSAHTRAPAYTHTSEIDRHKCHTRHSHGNSHFFRHKVRHVRHSRKTTHA